ncbi:MAG: PAS domain S-box protein [Candidatus Tectomicrobia bacterium]|uniref:histidine kinase n=1 Tax=Tectimicrobiota bacterium TaxID=2528274 RepID=A0A932GMM5_UNCTE|nr:PAS domain S-box protein [Candidatus Tectomicrobia bacterium]
MNLLPRNSGLMEYSSLSSRAEEKFEPIPSETVAPTLRLLPEAVRNPEESSEGKLLAAAFESFTRATETLRRSYGLLQKRVKDLTLELQQKNLELERNLREKEEVKNYLNNILESLQTGVVVLDIAGRVRLFNRAAQQLTGLDSRQVLGAPWQENLRPYLPPAGFDSFSPGSGQLVMETEFPIRNRGFTDSLMLRVSLAPMQAQEEQVAGVVVLLQDVTRLKHLEQEGQRRSRLLAMGEMAAHMAHEIRNPLGSIELFATLLRRELDHDPDKRDLAERISSGVRSLNHILTNLLLFTRSQKPTADLLGANDLVAETLQFARYLLEQNRVDLGVDFSPENPQIQGDRELLKQVFLNMILNAVEAMPAGGNLRVSTRLLSCPGIDPGRRQDRCKTDREVEIGFCDSGVGIPEDHISRIFDPFFTTKDSGTGLGLAIVHNIVAAHGGRVQVNSKPGQGTDLTLIFPGGQPAGVSGAH